MSNLIFSPTLSLNLSGTARSDQDLIIIGGGPAGLTAAIYAARANVNPLVLVGEVAGGQAATTHEIENYPGFPEGIGGSALGQRLQAQAERFGARVQLDFATEVDFKRYPFMVKTPLQSYTARAVIISTGSSPRKLGVPGEERFRARGVSYCATCDGYFFKDKEVIVVGGGNSALDESLFLTRLVSKITILHRREQLRADPILQQRALENPKIEFRWNTVVEEILGDTEARAVRVRNLKTDQVETIETGGVFIYIGHTPNTRLFEEQLALDQAGYIITDRRQHTSVPGVFAAGDVQDPIFRQIATAVGTGSAAAIEAVHFLDEQAAHIV